jgi:hypothetical protein
MKFGTVLDRLLDFLAEIEKSLKGSVNTSDTYRRSGKKQFCATLQS